MFLSDHRCTDKPVLFIFHRPFQLHDTIRSHFPDSCHFLRRNPQTLSLMFEQNAVSGTISLCPASDGFLPSQESPHLLPIIRFPDFFHPRQRGEKTETDCCKFQILIFQAFHNHPPFPVPLPRLVIPGGPASSYMIQPAGRLACSHYIILHRQYPRKPKHKNPCTRYISVSCKGLGCCQSAWMPHFSSVSPCSDPA